MKTQLPLGYLEEEFELFSILYGSGDGGAWHSFCKHMMHLVRALVTSLRELHTQFDHRSASRKT